MQSKEVRERIGEIGIIPCARVQEPDHARFAAETLYAAGIPVLEIPLTLPEAPEVIGDLAKRYPDLLWGQEPFWTSRMHGGQSMPEPDMSPARGLFPMWWPMPGRRESWSFPER